MAGAARSPSAKRSSLSSSTIGHGRSDAPSRSSSTLLRDIEAQSRAGSAETSAFTEADEKVIEQLRARLRPRMGNRAMNEPFTRRIRSPAAARLRHFRRSAAFQDLNPQAEPRDQLASRGHRRQADRGAGRQDPAADHQPAAAPSQILDGLDRVSGLVSRARSRRPSSSASAMPRISPTSSPAIAAAS